MKILHLDDDPLFLEMSKVFLEAFHNIDSDTINSAGEAFQKLNEYHYDAVVSDYEMPEMDGITFLETLRKRNLSVPFILFTGRDKDDLMLKAIEGGAGAYLQKSGAPKTQYSKLAKQIKQLSLHGEGGFCIQARYEENLPQESSS